MEHECDRTPYRHLTSACPNNLVAVALPLWASQATGKQVDDQRQNCSVVGKREELMGEYHPAHLAVRHVHVRDLEGHADSERKIGEIGVVRRPTAELESTCHVLLGVVQAGVVEGVGRVQQCPGADDRDQTQ